MITRGGVVPACWYAEVVAQVPERILRTVAAVPAEGVVEPEVTLALEEVRKSILAARLPQTLAAGLTVVAGAAILEVVALAAVLGVVALATLLVVITVGAFLRVVAIGAGLADQTIVTTLCPGGKERMSRLMRLVRAHRIDLTPLLTHAFPLDEIDQAYKLFASRQDSVLKIAIRVS